ncbi:oxidoreductase [Phytohalomonas tamaricis]|uniref:oxidoreductase n=1 Tax=Phytohalomonas tamaricis TaxID=2081032 RepID=UPI000D0B5930|nr:oxidoreductase [Phytohalomonas tamaricis]
MAGPIKVAIVGYGLAGKVFHAPLIVHTEGLVLDAVVSSRHDEIKADYPDVRVLSFEQVLDDTSIGLVVVATPNDTHAAIALQALERGKHVVIDKPFALNVADAKKLIAAAEQAGTVVSAFQNRRWDADFLTVKKVLASGELGELAQFESHYSRYRPQVQDRWGETDAPGTGNWFNLGSHTVDQALHLFGRPQGVLADFAIQRSGGRASDYFHVLLRYETHRVILHGSTLASWEAPRFLLHGTKASFVKYGLDTQEPALRAGDRPGHDYWGIDPQRGEVVIRHGEEIERHQIANERGAYPSYYRALKDAINGDGPNPVPPEEALATTELLEAAIRSTEERREILL